MKQLVLFCILCFLGIASAFAQETPLTLNENTLGEVTAQQPAPTFTFTASEPLTITVQSLTSQFAPLVLLYDEAFNILQRHSNPLGTPQVRFSFLPQVGQRYTLQVLGVEAQRGQFVLSLTPGEQAPVLASELRSGMQIEDRVTLAEPVQRYQIKSDRQTPLAIEILSLLPEGGISALLTDLAGNPLALSRQEMLGSTFFIPAAVDVSYELWIVHSGADRLEGYQIRVYPLGATTTTADTPPQNTTPIPANPTPSGTTAQVIIPFDGPCAVASKDNAGVNVRRGPSTGYDIVGGLTGDTVVPVTGRDETFTWWQVEYKTGLYGWVADVAVRRGGDCTAIGLAEYPALPDNTPIPIATEEQGE